MISCVVLIIELLSLYALKSLGIEERPAALILVLIIIFAVAYLLDIQRNEKLTAVRTALIIGFLLRMGLILFDVYGRNIYVLPNSATDAEMFYSGSLAVANGGTSISGLFVVVVGTLMKYIGVSKLYTQFLLMLCSMVSLYMGDKILRVCNVDDETRSSTILLLATLPNYAILSSIFLRESIVTMFITLAVYFYVCWMIRGGVSKILLAIISAFVATSFHSGAIAVLVGFIPGMILYNRDNKSLSLSLPSLVLTAVLVTLSAIFLNRYGDLFLGKFSRVDSLEDIANVRNVANSSYARFVGNSDSISNMIIYSIPRLVFFLFSPMPFQWRGLSDIIAFFFSSLFYVVVIFRVLKFLCSEPKSNRHQVLLLVIVALSSAFVFAWGVSNSGSAVRHRDKMIILFGVLLGLVNSKQSELNYGETSSQSKYIK